MNGKPNPQFYVAGGTMRPDAPSYVVRRADEELYQSLKRGEFCHVLTSRQMGKSSLMVRCAMRLRQEGSAIVILDLSAFGQNLTPEQWYDGLLLRMGEQLDLEEALEAYWQEHVERSPMQRFFSSLREVVLERLAKPLVIFVDEIDYVRILPFQTDEMFAAVRACYNRRSEDSAYNHLTFCLLGVATPSDLIKDRRTTPFNIGRRIELTDITPEEAGLLAKGLESEEKWGRLLLKRVLFWTGGHPYLTQALCMAVARDPARRSERGVDALCTELFLSSRARERDDNLYFVRDRLLRTESNTAALLDLYTKLWRKQKVTDDETNPLISALRLSGIVRASNGLLYIRNRIYEHVFDLSWISANMPNAERRRQQAAFRRGIIRASAIAAIIITALVGTFYWYLDGFVWEHVEYYNQFGKRWSEMVGIGRLTIHQFLTESC